MEITSTYKGRTEKCATVTGTTDKDGALALVMSHFGETKGSLFGWSVEQNDDGGITVKLFID